MNRKQKFDHNYKLANEYRDAFKKLKGECDKLKSTLRTISVGAHSSNAPDNFSDSTKVQWTACQALVEHKNVELPDGNLYI